ncbi:alpha/beta-hydrolase [Calocera viscosa TUFC12733]|uniref:Alpha/beta-hydrolase n=1 Tax=Calocera viscosa (strain TUFC12733) TaxID=1330018 RepID=A0A167PH96_CALVF|nr:alpha/beta-hydrolase [Calocera viscosa TUFC12733]
MQQPPSVLGGSSSKSPLPPLVFDNPDVTSSALDFVGNGAYHQFIRCPRTGMRVSFSEAGAREAPPILCCPPSFCSRYVGGANFEERARKMGVRLIVIDRPGMGGTDRCRIEERIEVSAKHVASVLEYLGIKKVALVSHSAGVIYVLDLLANHPALLGPSPRVYLMSSWVPTSKSSQIGLQLVPSVLVGSQHNILPAILPVIKGVNTSLAFSSALFHKKQKEKEKKANREWVFPERFRKEGQKYEPKPPFHVKLETSDEVGNFINGCAFAESLQGMSQEHLLCLGRGGPVNEAWYRQIVADIAKGYAERQDKVMIESWWGENDGMVPKKGRDWLDELIGTAGDAIEYRSIELEGIAHDDPPAKIEVTGAIFEDVREHA